MYVKLKITEPDEIYFIIIACFKRLPLFSIADFYGGVYKWFNYLKRNNHYITGYVNISNHLFALIAFTVSLNCFKTNGSLMSKVLNAVGEDASSSEYPTCKIKKVCYLSIHNIGKSEKH